LHVEGSFMQLNLGHGGGHDVAPTATPDERRDRGEADRAPSQAVRYSTDHAIR
jgi:hypothetical protein